MYKKIIAVCLLVCFVDLEAIKYPKDFLLLEKSLVLKYSSQQVKSHWVPSDKNKKIPNSKITNKITVKK